MYCIYELVEGPDYPTRKAKHRALALITAKTLLRRAILDAADAVCTYSCYASEEDVEADVLAETKYNPIDPLYPRRVCRKVECGLDDVT